MKGEAVYSQVRHALSRYILALGEPGYFFSLGRLDHPQVKHYCYLSLDCFCFMFGLLTRRTFVEFSSHLFDHSPNLLMQDLPARVFTDILNRVYYLVQRHLASSLSSSFPNVVGKR